MSAGQWADLLVIRALVVALLAFALWFAGVSVSAYWFLVVWVMAVFLELLRRQFNKRRT